MSHLSQYYLFENRDAMMDNASEKTADNGSKPVSRSNPFSRFGVVVAIVCTVILGMGVFATIQSRSHAQATYSQLTQSLQHEATLRSPRNLPTRAIPAGMVTNDGQLGEEPMLFTDARGDRFRVHNRGDRTPFSVAGVNDNPSMDADLRQLASQYRSASPSQQESIIQVLTQKLTEVFDARHKEQLARAEKLRTELQQTQELLDKRHQLKSKIIERRIKELTGQQDELSWNPQVANASSPSLESANGRTAMPTLETSFIPLPNGPPPTAPIFSNAPPPSVEFHFQPSGSYGPSLPPPKVPAANATQPYAGLPIDPASTRVAEEQLPASSVPPYAAVAPSISFSSTAVSTATEPSVDSLRSFMAVGFKLKRLILELESKKENLGNNHPSLKASGLENAIAETKTVWEFERQTLENERGSIESELSVAQKQSELAMEKRKRQAKRFDGGSGSIDDASDAERELLAAEREILLLKFRMKSTVNALDWMNKFQEKFLKSLAEKPEPVAS